MSPKLPVWCIMEAFSPMVKQLEREADCSPPPNIEVTNGWIPLHVFMACTGTVLFLRMRNGD